MVAFGGQFIQPLVVAKNVNDFPCFAGKKLVALSGNFIWKLYSLVYSSPFANPLIRCGKK
jgi:hypothetical protein